MEGTQRTSIPSVDDAEETTRRVAILYGRVLKLPEVRPDDDFFALGGTSLSALDLLELIGAEFALTVPVRTFYLATTVRDLARELQTLAAEGQTTC